MGEERRIPVIWLNSSVLEPPPFSPSLPLVQADQYAGPLEVAAAARALGRAAVVFVEEGNAVDSGGVYNAPPPAAANAVAPPPLVFVTSRRRHTYPVNVAFGATAAAASDRKKEVAHPPVRAAVLQAALRSFEGRAEASLAAALKEAGAKDGDAPPAAAVCALRELLAGTAR